MHVPGVLPTCRASTSLSSIGTAAAKAGPRFSPAMARSQRLDVRCESMVAFCWFDTVFDLLMLWEGVQL
jgi:hypothetical protein